MSIEIIDNVLWSKLCWEKSFEKTIDLDDILPQVGVAYSLVFDGDQVPSKIGKQCILWTPPHSELNGWSDKRPSEILSTFVLEGELRHRSACKLDYNFVVSRRSRLVELFEQASEDDIAPHSTFQLENGRYGLYWISSDHLTKSTVGKYIFMSGRGDLEVYVQVILSRERGRICLHYVSILHDWIRENALLTKYYLNPEEQVLFEVAIESAEVLVDHSMDNLPTNTIFGAQYW